MLQSPGLYSIIQMQCPKTESGVLGEGTSLSDGKIQDPEMNGGQYLKIQVAYCRHWISKGEPSTCEVKQVIG